MTTYIVRLTRDTRFVGIFHSNDTHDLGRLVNEVCCPSDCEFAALPAGGICSQDISTAPITIDAPLRTLPDNLGLTARLKEALFDTDLQWLPLDPEALHFGSRLDALLSSTSGRSRLNDALRNATGE